MQYLGAQHHSSCNHYRTICLNCQGENKRLTYRKCFSTRTIMHLSRSYKKAVESLSDALLTINRAEVCPLPNAPVLNLSYWNQQQAVYTIGYSGVYPTSYPFARNVSAIRWGQNKIADYFIHMPGEINLIRNSICTNDRADRINQFAGEYYTHAKKKDFTSFSSHVFDGALSDNLQYHKDCPVDSYIDGSILLLFLSDAADNKYSDHHRHHWAALRRDVENNTIILTHKNDEEYACVIDPRALFSHVQNKGYYHFVGYFKCPNNSDLPSPDEPA